MPLLYLAGWVFQKMKTLGWHPSLFIFWKNPSEIEIWSVREWAPLDPPPIYILLIDMTAHNSIYFFNNISRLSFDCNMTTYIMSTFIEINYYLSTKQVVKSVSASRHLYVKVIYCFRSFKVGNLFQCGSCKLINFHVLYSKRSWLFCLKFLLPFINFKFILNAIFVNYTFFYGIVTEKKEEYNQHVWNHTRRRPPSKKEKIAGTISPTYILANPFA